MSLATLQRKVQNGEVRCFNIITDPHSAQFGQECSRLLMEALPDGSAAGKVVCTRKDCRIKYEIKNGKVQAVARWDQQMKTYNPIITKE